MGNAEGKQAQEEDAENVPPRPVKHSFMLHLTPSRGSEATRWHGRMEHLSEGKLVEQTNAISVNRLLAALSDTVKKITSKSPKD